MSVLDFDDRDRAHVSEAEFTSFLYSHYGVNEGDHTKVVNDVVYFCNSAGCKLALYDRREEYGQII